MILDQKVFNWVYGFVKCIVVARSGKAQRKELALYAWSCPLLIVLS